MWPAEAVKLYISRKVSLYTIPPNLTLNGTIYKEHIMCVPSDTNEQKNVIFFSIKVIKTYKVYDFKLNHLYSRYT